MALNDLELAVVTVLRDKNLKKGLGAAGKSTEEFGRKSERAMGRTQKAIQSLINNKFGVAALAAGFALAAKRATDMWLRQATLMSQTAARGEEIRAKFGVVFADLAEDQQDFVAGLAESVGRSRLELTDAMSSFQDIFVPMGLAREDAAALSQDMVKLGIDLASFNNKADKDVFRDIQSALVGNSETVKKYGVIINETRIKEIAYRKGLAETGAELTERQKLLARIIGLTEDTQDAQGDAVRTADSFTNSQKRLHGVLEDVRDTLGQEVNQEILNAIEAYGGLEVVARDLASALGFVGAMSVASIDALGKVGKFYQENKWLLYVLGGPGVRLGMNAMQGGKDFVENANKPKGGVQIADIDSGAFSSANAEFFGIKQGTENVVEATEDWRKELSQMSPEVQKYIENLDRLALQFQKTARIQELAAEEATDPIDGVGEAVAKLDHQYRIVTGPNGGFKLVTDHFWLQGQLAAKAAVDVTKFGVEQKKQQEEQKKELEELEKKIEDLQPAFAKANIFVDNFAQTMANVAQTGKLEFGDMVRSIVADLAFLQARFVGINILKGINPDFGLNPAFQGAFSLFGQGGAFAHGTTTYNAQGRVLGGPTAFSLGSGVAIGGELGRNTESLMPLSRMPSGRLGVHAQGGGGTVNLTVVAMDTQSGAQFLLNNAEAIGFSVLEAMNSYPAVRDGIKGA